MANTFRIEGLETVLKNLNKEINKVENRTLSGLIRGIILVRRSMEHNPPVIPVDTGNLRSSWFVITSKGGTITPKPSFVGDEQAELDAAWSRVVAREMPKATSSPYPAIVFGFTANYATAVHEDFTKIRKRPGSGPKFLEAALARNKKAILQKIKEEAQIK